ncbi:MAG: hypothetical protein ACYDH0_11740 [Candidatus Aminicenantales bacterium]
MKQMRPAIPACWPLMLALLLCFRPADAGGSASQDLGAARKVFEAIDRIEREQAATPDGPVRSVAVTETELNAYIARRIETEEADVMRALQLKLFPRNRIEGRILLDFEGRALPDYVKQKMNIYFAGVLETGERRGRIRFESLYLEEQRIQVSLLDMIGSLIARWNGTEPVRIEDWVELPFGIRNLETQSGRLVAFY